MVTATLSTTYNSITRWITGLPLNTRISNLLTLAKLPPLEAYLDYLSLRYAICLHFLPSHHVLGPPRAAPNTSPSLPGLHCLYNLSKHLVMGKLENWTSTSSAEGVPITPSPNPDKTTRPQKHHKQWLESQGNHTIIIYTDGSKLDNGSTGCGWVIYHCGDQHLYRLDEGSCHLGSRAKVYDAELHVVQEAVSTLLTTTAPWGTVFICIDNQAVMATLNFNKHNHEYARWALDLSKTCAPLAGKSPSPGARLIAILEATRGPTHSPSKGPAAQFRAASHLQQKPGYSCKYEHSSWNDGRLSSPSLRHPSRSPNTSKRWNGPTHELSGGSSATMHQPTHPPTSPLTPAHAAWTSSHHPTSSRNADC